MYIGAFTIVFFLLFNNSIYGIGVESNSLSLSIFKLVGYIIVLLGTLFLTFYGTKIIASLYKKNIKTNVSMKVIDSLNLGNNNRCILFEANKMVYLVVISAGNATLLNSFPIEELEVSEADFVKTDIKIADIFKEMRKKD